MQILEKFTSGQAPAGPAGLDSRSESKAPPSAGGLQFEKAKGLASAAKQGGGIEFSDDKVQRSGGSTSGPGGNSAGGFPQMSMGIGEGILQNANKQTPSSSAAKLGGEPESGSSPGAPSSVAKTGHEMNIAKASSLLDE